MCNQSQGYYGPNNTLSPATQAVLDALSMEELNGPQQLMARAHAAATLRATADQVVPEPDDWDKDNFSTQALRLRCVMRGRILAIAAELEAQTEPQITYGQTQPHG